MPDSFFRLRGRGIDPTAEKRARDERERDRENERERERENDRDRERERVCGVRGGGEQGRLIEWQCFIVLGTVPHGQTVGYMVAACVVIWAVRAPTEAADKETFWIYEG